MEQSPVTWTVTLCVPASHPDFAGHFPSFPLLPAVSQISLVKGLLEQHLGYTIDCIGVRRTKFKAMLQPKTELRVVLTIISESEASWQMSDHSRTYSLGQFKFQKE